MQKGYIGFDKALKYLFQNATEVSYTQTLQSGTPIGTLEIDGQSTTIYAPAGGSASVSYSPVQISGTKIGVLTINGTPQDVYVPEVTATPVGSTGTKIGTITIDGVDYDFYVPTGGYTAGDYIDITGTTISVDRCPRGGSTEVEFDYTGTIQTFTAPATGTYKLEVWGAQGGSNSETRGGYGGYSVGEVDLDAGDTLYVCVGGAGTGGSTSTAGYNGGGIANHSGGWDRGAGGGATHIAKITGLLNTLESNLSDVLIVAGGGGGGGLYSGAECGDGGDGGGYLGADGDQRDSSHLSEIGGGGTQSTGGIGGNNNGDDGSFGQGADRTSTSDYGGSGGGGGLYGGGASCNTSGAGGGSGYISGLNNACMYGYNVPTSSAATTKTISVNNHSSTALAETAKEGNGYAKITFSNADLNDLVIKSELNLAVATLQANFQAGVDSIYDACVAKGSTPASHSLSDVVDAIMAI